MVVVVVVVEEEEGFPLGWLGPRSKGGLEMKKGAEGPTVFLLGLWGRD